MNSKQQVFWAVAGAVIAAVVGSIVTSWWSQPTRPSSKTILYWSTVRELPANTCSSSDRVSRTCYLVAIDFKNPEYDEVGPFVAKIDFPTDISSPLSETGNFSADPGYDFISSDISTSLTTPRQREIKFARFPGGSTVKVTAIIGSGGFSDPKVVSVTPSVKLQELREFRGVGVEGYLLSGLIGFLLLPIILLGVAFFQWLAREQSKNGASSG